MVEEAGAMSEVWNRDETEAGLLAALAGTGDAGEMRALLTEVLTAAEYRALVRRWAILELLERGFTQRKIAEEIGGSLCNVTRGAKILRNPESVAAKALRRLELNERTGKESES